MSRVCLECMGRCWIYENGVALKCPECNGKGVEPDFEAEVVDALRADVERFESDLRELAQFDTGASGDTHDFLNQIVNDVVEGR